MEQFSVWLTVDPIVSFTILLLASLTVPPLVEKLRLPGLVGLLLAGIILGPHGLGWLKAESETVKLLSDIGKVYLMFVAGLEIDMQAFRKTRNRSLAFGLLTFAIPLITGTALGLGLNMGWNAAILLGSLLASHTLLAYPLLQRLGVVRNQAVTITIGATIFTDIGALLVLAICVSIYQGSFTWFRLLIQLVILGLYAALVLIGLDRLGKTYFRRSGNDEGNQFLFILLALFVSSVGAQVIQTENIVGAFLAGLAVNDVLGKSAVKEKIEFVGTVLFIPFFFIAMGLLINVPVFIRVLLTDTTTVAAVVAGLIGSKFIAAWCIKQLYSYSWVETFTMWSLSLPQVAATLAAGLVGYQVGLLSEAVFNSIIVLMLVTSTLGPVLTHRYARHLSVPARQLPFMTLPISQSSRKADPVLPSFNVVVSVHNPETEPYLVEMAGLLAQQQRGKLFPLAIAQPATSLNDPTFTKILQQTHRLLKRATDIGQRLGVSTHSLLRIDRDIANGICHHSCEQSAQLIVMGYGDMTTLQARLLGSTVGQVFDYSPAPVAVMKLLQSPLQLQRVIVPIWNIRPYFNAQIKFAQHVAAATQTIVTVLYICSPQATVSEQMLYPHQVRRVLNKRSSPANNSLLKIKVTVVPHSDISGAVLRFTQSRDLVVLHGRDLIPVREIPTSEWGTTLLQKLTCSVALFKEPTL